MHPAEQPDGPFYRPASLRMNGTTQASATLPPKIREALENALRVRAGLLQTVPDLEGKPYQDYPRIACVDEDPEQVLANTFADDFWPPRWRSQSNRFDRSRARHDVLNRLMIWQRELERDAAFPAESRVELERLIERFANTGEVLVACRVRAPRNQYGMCVEDIRYQPLCADMSEDVASALAVLHNALIEVLVWLDADLPVRQETNELRFQRDLMQRRIDEQIDALLAREKRHAAAVKKVKARLAAQKQEAEALLAAAQERMREAMLLATLAEQVLRETQKVPDAG